jgi:hypothetical protein
MKDKQGNTYHAWGIMEKSRGFVLPETIRRTRAEAREAFFSQNSIEWIMKHGDNYKAAKIEIVIVKDWNRETKRYE